MRRRRYTATAKARPRTIDYTRATKFLCFALHAIPNDDLLASQPWHSVGAYAPNWVKPRLNSVTSEAACVAFLLPRSLALLPLPTVIEADDAPYAIAYDFALASASKADGESYLPIAKYYGFTIATLPSHDWRRAKSFASLSLYNEALLFADRAILNLATLYPERIDAIEKTQLRFSKLLSLYCDQSTTPEGQLAANMAMNLALKCITTLSDGRIN